MRRNILGHGSEGSSGGFCIFKTRKKKIAAALSSIEVKVTWYVSGCFDLRGLDNFMVTNS